MDLQGRRLIGEILVNLGFASIPQVNEARRKQMVQPDILLGEYLVELGYVTPAQLLEALSRQAEYFERHSSPSTLGDPFPGLPAKATELIQLVNLTLFQNVVNLLDEGLYIEAFGEHREEDRILFVNHAFASWMGMKSEDLQGKSGPLVVHFLSRFFANPQDFLSRVREAMAQFPQPQQMVVEATKPQLMKVTIRFVPLRNKAGELVGMAAFMRKL